MSAITANYEELEYRSYAVLAKTARASLLLNRKPFLLMVRLGWDLIWLDAVLLSFLRFLHNSKQSHDCTLEKLSGEERAEISIRLQSTRDKVTKIITSARALPQLAVYESILNRLQLRSEELQAHADALANGSVPIILTRRAQKRVTRAILGDSKPNENLSEAFRRHY
jgi:hypothetical protein